MGAAWGWRRYPLLAQAAVADRGEQVVHALALDDHTCHHVAVRPSDPARPQHPQHVADRQGACLDADVVGGEALLQVLAVGALADFACI
jgi:hypothetical protein